MSRSFEGEIYPVGEAPWYSSHAMVGVKFPKEILREPHMSLTLTGVEIPKSNYTYKITIEVEQ